MTDNNDLIDLYSKRILALAANIALTERLDNPQSTVKKRSPMCGSMVTVDISINESKVINYGQEVKACALGQAAASIISKSIIGSDVDQILTAREELINMLTKDGSCPNKPFEELEVLQPAKDFKNRHSSILLTFDAIADAINEINMIEAEKTF
jgi:NifU-like protein involved in Fe-S cluster formation